jgi:hypothetical protein
MQQFHVFGAETQLKVPVQESVHLVGSEAQVADPQLEELASGPQARERQGRICPCAERYLTRVGAWSIRYARPWWISALVTAW